MHKPSLLLKTAHRL